VFDNNFAICSLRLDAGLLSAGQAA